MTCTRPSRLKVPKDATPLARWANSGFRWGSSGVLSPEESLQICDVIFLAQVLNGWLSDHLSYYRGCNIEPQDSQTEIPYRVISTGNRDKTHSQTAVDQIKKSESTMLGLGSHCTCLGIRKKMAQRYHRKYREKATKNAPQQGTINLDS